MPVREGLSNYGFRDFCVGGRNANNPEHEIPVAAWSGGQRGCDRARQSWWERFPGLSAMSITQAKRRSAISIQGQDADAGAAPGVGAGGGAPGMFCAHA